MDALRRLQFRFAHLDWLWQRSLSPIFLGCLVFLTMLSMTFYVQLIAFRAEQNTTRQQSQLLAKDISHLLERAITRYVDGLTLSGRSLSSAITTSENEAFYYLRSMQETLPALLQLNLTENGKTLLAYPAAQSLQRLLGRDTPADKLYQTLPADTAAVLGPVTSRNGSPIFMVRIAVPANSHPSTQMLTAVFDAQRYFNKQLRELNFNNAAIAMRNLQPDQQAGAVFRGQPALFTEHSAGFSSLTLPGGQQWQIAALLPSEALAEYQRLYQLHFVVYILVTGLISLLITWVRIKAIQYQHHSKYDSLTGAMSRNEFLDRLEIEWSRSQRQGCPCTLIAVDIHQLKAINDRYGFHAGDAVLCEVVERFRSDLRRVDLLGRLGSDDFAIVAWGSNAQAATQLAERLRRQLREEPLIHNGEEIKILGNFGIAEFGVHGEGVDDCLEAAMNAIKQGEQDQGDKLVLASSLAADSRSQAC